VRLLRNFLYGRSVAVSEPFGLPTGSLTVMCLIAANPNSSQKQLADRAGIARPGLVGILDALEERGLITRERSPADRRLNLLVLTDKGTETMNTLFSTVTEIGAPIRDALGPEDMQRLIE